MDADAAERDPCNVFVKYLPSAYRDHDLFNLFHPFGDVQSCKVMIDQQTGNSLGYGFVRYGAPEEAVIAIERMNGQRVGNKQLLCKLSNAANTTPTDNLYVKPLLPTTTEDDLHALFVPYGTVIDVKVMLDKNTGASRQIGFVRFETVEQAVAAQQEMNGHRLTPTSPPLVVKFAETESEKMVRKAKIREQMQLRSFALPFSSRPAAAPQHFQGAIQAIPAVIPHDPYMYYSQTAGYAAQGPSPASGWSLLPHQYIQSPIYSPPTTAATPLGLMGHGLPSPPTLRGLMQPPQFSATDLLADQMSRLGLGGRHMSLSQPTATPPLTAMRRASVPIPQQYFPFNQAAAAGGPPPGDTNLFVFHLPSEIDDNALYRLFSPYGTLESVKVMTDKGTGESRGFGFVRYARHQDAMVAVQAMNGYPVGKKHLKVQFKAMHGGFGHLSERKLSTASSIGNESDPQPQPAPQSGSQQPSPSGGVDQFSLLPPSIYGGASFGGMTSSQGGYSRSMRDAPDQ